MVYVFLYYFAIRILFSTVWISANFALCTKEYFMLFWPAVSFLRCVNFAIDLCRSNKILADVWSILTFCGFANHWQRASFSWSFIPSINVKHFFAPVHMVWWRKFRQMNMHGLNYFNDNKPSVGICGIVRYRVSIMF